MPSVKRKADQSAEGGSKVSLPFRPRKALGSFPLQRTAKPSAYHGETSSTHGMLAAAMEDDMIDDAASVDDEDDEEDGDDAEDMVDEDEDEEGFTDLEEDETAPNGAEKDTKGKKASLYKAPTAEEMEELRRQEEERGGHFGFAMKVSSMWPEV